MSEEVATDNWRRILADCEHLIGRQFTGDRRNGYTYSFFGLVHGDDDYYYGMWSKDGGIRLLSCVVNLDGHGYELVPEPLLET